MIKKSLLAFGVFLLLHIIIRDVIKPDVEITQAPWQGNQQVGQRYLYAKGKIDNVVAGSSISAPLDFTSAKNSITNLAFSGEGTHRGIELVVKKGKKTGVFPNTIFVEINTLDNYKQSTFDETIYNPLLIYPRKYIPSLRDGKQPLTWTATILEKHITHFFIPHQYTFLQDVLQATPTHKHDDGKDDLLPNERFKILAFAGKEKEEAEAKLTENLNFLIENGCTPIFYEVPVSDRYRLSPKYTAIREIIEENYPLSKYNYINYSLDSNYQTYDGLHLTAEDSPKYSAYLSHVMDSILLLERK